MGIAMAREAIFSPSEKEISQTQLSDFIRLCESRTSRDFSRYTDFESFSIAQYRDFWKYLLEWSGLPYEGDPTVVCTDDECEKATFFPDIRVNYAECLLSIKNPADTGTPALWSCRPEQETERLTRGELRRRVTSLAASLEELGIGAGSRIAIIAHNDSQAVIAVLAAAALGAVVSSTSTELAAAATIARFEETRPDLLFCHLRSPFAAVEKQLRRRVEDVAAALPSLKCVVALDDGPAPAGLPIPFETLNQLIERSPHAPKPWRRFPFNHPLFVLFTSGTSGRPKCLIQGAGGMLVQNVKEMRLHLDVRPADKIFFQTSAAWVIWQELLANLAVGAEVVLNSRPVSSPKALWEIVGDEAVTIFGTSPAYLQLCEANAFRPRDHYGLQSLRTLISAGSVLYKSQQDWVAANVKALPVRSMYGSTDIAACFVLPNPNLPVYAAECQSRSLGLDVRALNPGEMGLPSPIGEVVCANPFPSRPLGFLNDADGCRFHKAYFAQNPGFWTQGDFIEFMAEGSARLYGRCDGVLNIRGVRFGPVEIYDAIKTIPEIAGSVAVAQTWPAAPGGEQLVLLVALAKGAELSEPLIRRIKAEIGRRASPVHIPDVIAQVAELPMTHNGKLSERSAADAINGRAVVNREALRNPECLEMIAACAALRMPAENLASGIASRASQSTEQIVQGIWERAFGCSPLARDDDFFDLGGDSITAMKILSALGEAFGAAFPMSDLFRASTIASLAQRIDSRAGAEDHSLLVTLRDGAGGPPLFIVHGVDGSIMKFRPLARSIDYPGAVIGIQAKGVAGAGEPLCSIEEMARLYVDWIKTVQPHGPYAIAGYSLGGLIAIEMARTLLTGGEEIGSLILLDTAINKKHWPMDVWLGALLRRIAIDAGKFFARAGGTKWDYAASRLLGLCRRLSPMDDPKKRFLGTDILPPLLESVFNRCLIAFRNYRPRFFDGAITLFVAEDGVYRTCNAKRLWSRWAANVSIRRVPGLHSTMLYSSHNGALAAGLSERLGVASREMGAAPPDFRHYDAKARGRLDTFKPAPG